MTDLYPRNDGPPGVQTFQHGPQLVIYSDHERHSLEEAAALFGVRDWRHMSVSVRGQERMPTWGELTHLVYADHPMLGFDRSRDVLQFLPPPADYVNLAEVLHLWQPR